MPYDPRPGDVVEVSYQATITGSGPKAGHVRNEQPVYTLIQRVIPLDWTPGTLLWADGTAWVVRVSSYNVSYRVMPINLAETWVTLSIEEFANQYPDAKVVFDGSVLGLEDEITDEDAAHTRGSLGARIPCIGEREQQIADAYRDSGWGDVDGQHHDITTLGEPFLEVFRQTVKDVQKKTKLDEPCI